MDKKIILAPMAGITDLPFRLLCKRFGAALVYTEMISAKGLIYNNKNTGEMLQMHEEEKPCAVQLFGSEPEVIAEAAYKIQGMGMKLIDINMGCPAPKIVKNGEGSALMRNPELVYKIVHKVSSRIDIPVTVKIRKGFDLNNCNAVEVALAAEQGGAAAVCVHGRTRTEYYSGEADWDIIKEVKKSLRIPVIGNGDVKSLEDAEKMMELTGCDSVMIGRAACGSPWVFSGKTPSLEEKMSIALEHAKLLADYKGEYIGIREMRKHLSWYLKGINGAAKLKVRINTAETLEDIKKIIYEEILGEID